MMVYGFNLDGRHRVIAKVASRAALRRALVDLGYSVSDARLRDYGSRTENVGAVAAAEAAGENVPLVRGTVDFGGEYVPLEPFGSTPAHRTTDDRKGRR